MTIDLRGSTHKSLRDGTHRMRAPATTMQEFGGSRERLGITRLADVTGLDRIGIPVFMAVRPASRSISVSQGKGLTREAARVSAFMEAVEGWHAERVEAPLRYDSWASLKRHSRALDITRLPLCRGARLRPSTPLLWVKGFDLIAAEPVWVPFECVSTYFVEPARAGGIFLASSNGLASGNHLLEAIVHGLCELIERDASAIWTARGGVQRATDRLNAKTLPGTPAALLARMSDADVLPSVWEMTTDTGVPAFYCQIVDDPEAPRWALRGISAGQGCHLDPEVALVRAITEAAQSRLTRISGARDDMFDYSAHGHPDDIRAAAELAQHHEGRPFERADLSTETFEDDIALLLAAVVRAGVDSVAVIDLGRPEIGIPVVRVVAPGLESDPSSRHYVPGHRALVAAGEA